MTDSRLNEAERPLQHSFRKLRIFNGLVVFTTLLAAYLPMRALPGQRALPPSTLALEVVPVPLPAAASPLQLAGAWELASADRRFGGLSALAIDRGKLLAVSDRGAVLRFDFPSAARPAVWLADLRHGPGPWGKKWARDAESLAPDPEGRGWWVGYEQVHSLWHFDSGFNHALGSIDLQRADWWNNRGAEGLIIEGDQLLAMAENGRDAVRAGKGAVVRLPLLAGADVAEAARAPDGRAWLLLRSKGSTGIAQSIAPLIRTSAGYRTGAAWPLPKGAFDNFEGMAIEALPAGGLRFWLISDDGHRIMARTLLVALDYVPPAEHDKGPAGDAGPLRKPNGNAP